MSNQQTWQERFDEKYYGDNNWLNNMQRNDDEAHAIKSFIQQELDNLGKEMLDKFDHLSFGPYKHPSDTIRQLLKDNE